MTGIDVFYRYEHVLNLIGEKMVLTLCILSLILFILSKEMLENVKKMLESVGHISGFITVIVGGSVDAKRIFVMNTSCSVVSFCAECSAAILA